MPPIASVRLQRAFGTRQIPRVGGGKVAVRLALLSPANRPVAVTGDLEHFWREVYPQVRAELRGRYHKHSWPDDPLARVDEKSRNPGKAGGKRRG